MAISKEMRQEIDALRNEIEGLRADNHVLHTEIVALGAKIEAKRQEIDAFRSGKNTTPRQRRKDVLFRLKEHFDAQPESTGCVFFVDTVNNVLMVRRKGTPQRPVREETITRALTELGLSL